MKFIYIALFGAIAVLLFTFATNPAYAATTITKVFNGGTGVGTFTAGLVGGSGTNNLFTSATTSLSGGSQINISNSPIVVSGGGASVASIVADSIGDTQLAFNTGQNLTTADSPTFTGLTVSGQAGSGTRFITVNNAGLVSSVAAQLAVANGGTGSTTLTGILKGNGTSQVGTAVNGTDYTLITANTCSAGSHFSQVTAGGLFTCTADSGGGTFSWTPTTNFNLAVNATSTPIWFQQGLMASSTSRLSTTTVYVQDNDGFQVVGGIAGANTSLNHLALFKNAGTGSSHLSFCNQTTGCTTGDGSDTGILSDGGLIIRNNETAAIRLFTGGTLEALTIATTTGYVGIATTSPYQTLSVGGRANVLSSLSIGSSTPFFDPLRNLVDAQCNQDTYCVFNLGNNSKTGTASADFILTNGDSTNTTYYSDIGINSNQYTDTTYPGFNQPNQAYWYNTDGPLSIYAATTTQAKSYISMGVGGAGLTNEALRIAGNRNIGIGTTTPFAKVAIHALNGETNTRLFEVASSTASATTTLFTVNNDGKVGVGTTTPGGTFAVNGTIFNNSTTTTTGLNVLAPTTGTSTINIYSKTAGFGGQIILEDQGGGACTSITTKAGTPTYAVVTCPTEL